MGNTIFTDEWIKDALETGFELQRTLNLVKGIAKRCALLEKEIRQKKGNCKSEQGLGD